MSNLTLTQLARIIKSEWFLILSALLVTAIVALSMLTFFRTKKPQPPQGVPWQNQIYPGQTTTSDLRQKLGDPVDIQNQEGQILYFYPSINKNRLHKITTKDNLVTKIEEQVIENEKGNLTDYQSQHGPAQAEVYGRHGTFAPAFVWPQKGIAVFANKFDGTIVEIWYFKPTTLANFLAANPALSRSLPEKF